MRIINNVAASVHKSLEAVGRLWLEVSNSIHTDASPMRRCRESKTKNFSIVACKRMLINIIIQFVFLVIIEYCG